MSNQFLKLRRSAVPGKIPETSSLDLGELAINTFDGQLFLKKSGSQGPIVTVVGSTGSFTGSFTGNGAGLTNIPASGITGLNLSRIATGSVTASVNTDISASFRITSGSNTLLNVTREGFVWIGNGAFTNQAYQLDVNGTARVTGQLTVNSNISLPYVAGSTITVKSQFNNRDVSISSAGRITLGESGASLTAGSYSFYYLPTAGSILGFAVMAAGIEDYGRAAFHVVNNKIVLGQTYQAFSNNQQTVVAEFTSLNNWKLYGALAGNYQGGLVMTIAGGFSGTFSDANNQGVAGRLILKGGDAQTTVTNINTAGGNIEINGGLGTGTGIPGDIIFATPALTASGNTLQSLTNRVWIKGDTGTLTNKGTSSLAVLDISGSSIFTGSIGLQGSLTASNALITGTLTAQTLVVQTITSSILYSSGSNIFGNRLTDTQQFTGSVLITGSTVSLTGGSFSGSGANLFNIPASGITGLNLSRIATGSISASVNTDISSSFRLTSGSNTLLNVTRDGLVWIGNGTFTNQAYQLDVNGNTRVSGNLYIGNAGHYLFADTNNFRIYDKNNSILFQAFPVGVGDNELYIQSGVGKIYINATNAGATILDGAVGSLQPETFIIKRGYFGNVSPTTKNVFKVQTQYYSNITNATILRGIYVDIDDTTTYTGFADVRAFESLKGGGYFNTTNVAASAILQADSTTKGFLAPRMTAAQRTAISTPAQGLIVYDTGSATEGLWLYNSGSTPGWQEVLTNSGSQSISGSITASNALITGTLTVTQNILIGSSQFNNTSSVTVAGVTTVSQLSTSSYTSCFYNYTVASASNARSGQVMTVWNGNSLRYIEVVTTDIGDTNLVAVSASLSSGFVRLQVSASSGWTFKNISNLL
jgi:hypothetical protein